LIEKKLREIKLKKKKLIEWLKLLKEEKKE